MPYIEWAPFFAFFLSTTLSPGPNNMASAANGLQHGFKKTLPFIFGIFFGFFTAMIAISLVSTALLSFIPQFQLYLKVIGGSYILWLAYRAMAKGFQVERKDQPSLNFSSGFLLQFLNPKVTFFGLTIFTSFLHPLTGNYFFLATAAFLLAGWIFMVNSFWAGAGSVIFNYFDNPIVMRIFSLTLAAMLVYAALNIFGFFEFMETLG